MAFTDINGEDRLVQRTFAEHLEHRLGWESSCAWNNETFGPQEPIRAAAPGADHAEGLTVDLSRIDFEKLREEFGKVHRKHAALQDYYKRYQAIVADYNREKDRATVEATFVQLVALVASLDDEQTRAAREGLNDDELALFDLLRKDEIGKAERERVKQASRELLKSLQALLALMPAWARNTNTQAEVKVFILDELWRSLPRPPFTDEETEALAERVYGFVWQRAAAGHLAAPTARP